MGGNLYPELCRLLAASGCTFVRQAKGSHEVWRSPLTNRTISVPKNLMMRHTANGILKDAGLPKAS